MAAAAPDKNAGHDWEHRAEILTTEPLVLFLAIQFGDEKAYRCGDGRSVPAASVLSLDGPLHLRICFLRVGESVVGRAFHSG